MHIRSAFTREVGYTFNAMRHHGFLVLPGSGLSSSDAREMPRSMRATIRFRKSKNGLRARPVGITIEHKYDGLGRLVRTDRTVTGPVTTVFEHVRNGLQVVGNIDATNTNTAPTWTNSPRGLRPVESQQIQTNSATQYINVADEIDPARLTYRPSDSSGSVTEWR